MEGGQGILALAAEAAHDLEQAAGVGGDDGLGVGREQVADLAVGELIGGFGVEQVVDAGGAAAEAGLFDLGDLEAGDGGKEIAGLLEDVLRVAEVAGVVVCDAEGEGMAGVCGGARRGSRRCPCTWR